MAQEPHSVTVKQLADQSGSAQMNDDEIDESMEPMPMRSMYDQVNDMAERFAGTRMGQWVIQRADQTLKMIENTVKWSLPQGRPMLVGRGNERKLERPLPWIPFIMMIIALRLIRVWLSIGALMIGNGPVTPYEMVYFIQTRRRKLRAIRVHGLKAIKRKETESNTMKTGSAHLSFASKIRQLLSRAICRPGQHCEPATRVFFARGKEQLNEKTSVDRQTPKRRRNDEDCLSDLNMTCDQMLSKYANENSDDDSDFIPNPDDDIDDGSTSSTSSNDTSIDVDRNMENGEKNGHATEHNDQMGENSQHEGSIVEVKEHTGRKRNIPKPIIVIKKEPLTDVESGNEQTPKMSESNKTGDGDGDSNQQSVDAPHSHVNQTPNNITTVKTPTTSENMNGYKLQVDDSNDLKSTPGHISAAMMKPLMLPKLSDNAITGSPPDFNSIIKPMQNHNNTSTFHTDAQSTPINNCPDDATKMDESQKIQMQKNQQNQQSYHHQNRYRGKNRR